MDGGAALVYEADLERLEASGEVSRHRRMSSPGGDTAEARSCRAQAQHFVFSQLNVTYDGNDTYLMAEFDRDLHRRAVALVAWRPQAWPATQRSPQ